MIIYKLFRYIIFLLLLGTTAMYLMRHTVEIPSFLGNYFSILDKAHLSIRKSMLGNSEEMLAQDLQKEGDNLVLSYQELSEDFFNDIGLETALFAALGRNFTDLHYMIEAYLTHYPEFKDVTVYENDNLIYKYNSSKRPSDFALRYNKNVYGENLVLEIEYDATILQDSVNKFTQAIIIKNQNTFYYNRKDKSITIPFLNMIEGYYNPIDPASKLPNGKMLYSYKLNDEFRFPLTLFIVSENKTQGADWINMLWALIFPAIWLALFFMDRFLSHFIYQKTQMRKQHQAMSQMANFKDDNNEKEDSLAWLDRFIKIEELTDKEIAHQEQVNELIKKNNRGSEDQ